MAKFPECLKSFIDFIKICILSPVFSGSLRIYAKAEIITEVIAETFPSADPDDQAAGDPHASA